MSSILYKKINNIIRNFFANKYICIIGVDGTGKTSITNELKRILRKDAIIQYMGHKQNKFDIDNINNKRATSSFLILITRLIEMWARVIRHWPNENIIVYDRYAWDRYINQQGLTRVITKMLFKTLFPKPKYIFYLHCPLDVSLVRKDDIVDLIEFKIRKERFDAEFLKSKSIIAINTKEVNMKSAIAIITEVLPESFIVRA